jgi:hypothetical protein
MCAIAGLYAFAPSAPPADRAQLRTIRDHMSARGPDGLGEWFSNDGRVALGHRRLAIIDLTEGGAQPMHSADGQLVITFNGEIYNYRELRRELEAQGHVFRSESDTEVLLHLYQAKGTAMLQDLRGMYAFALWDAAKQALLLARDPFGIKPLYYTPTGTGNSEPQRHPALRLPGQGAAGRRPDRHRARARRPHRLLPVGQRARALHAVPRHPRAAGRALPVGERAGRRRTRALLPDHRHPGPRRRQPRTRHPGRRARRHWCDHARQHCRAPRGRRAGGHVFVGRH